MDALRTKDIENLILNIDTKKLLIDRDVAMIYGVETKRINEAVKNNPDRFPQGYILEIDNKIKNELVENFDRFEKLKHSTVKPKLAQQSNRILEEVIDIELDLLEDDEDGEVKETTTKFEFNLGFAKVSRSIKKVKK